MNKHVPDLIEDFLRYLKVQKGRTSLTVRNYRLYLKRFMAWAITSRLNQINELSKEKIRDYRLWLSHQKSQGGTQLSSATQNYHLTALRSFFNYLRHKDVSTLPASSISLSPAQKRKVLTLTEMEKHDLLQAVKQSHEPDIVKIRDEIIIKLIAASGLKVSELVALDKKQLDTTQAKFNLTRNHTTYNLNLTTDLYQLIKSYLEKRTDQSSFVFVRHDRASDNKPGRLTPRSVQRSLERYRKLAGLKQKITPHTLRHSFASRLAAQGADLVTLQKSLGLKHKSTAHVYQKMTEATSLTKDEK